MNILVICHYGLYQHLSASFVHNQAKAFAAAGHQVRVIIPTPVGKQFRGGKIGPLFYESEADGVGLYYVRYLSASRYGKKSFNVKSAATAIGTRIKTITNGFVPDIIHAHTLGFDSGIGAWLKEKFGCPLVVTTHGSDTEKPLKEGKTDMLRSACDQADCIAAVSDRLRARLLSCGTSTRVVTILNGFSLENMCEACRKDPFSMIQVGHLIPSKRNDVTIRAFAKLRRKYPEMTLKIIGKGVLREQLETLAQELGVMDAVTFTGEIPNSQVFSAMAEASFFVMASKPEGFGIVYLEAMANRCVTIGTEGEGIADLIVSGENGFLVPADDPDAVASVIDRCLTDSREAEEIGRRGHMSAIGLTWERNAALYVALFEDLL